jgi:hypothetical protein
VEAQINKLLSSLRSPIEVGACGLETLSLSGEDLDGEGWPDQILRPCISRLRESGRTLAKDELVPPEKSLLDALTAFLGSNLPPPAPLDIDPVQRPPTEESGLRVFCHHDLETEVRHALSAGWPGRFDVIRHDDQDRILVVLTFQKFGLQDLDLHVL